MTRREMARLTVIGKLIERTATVGDASMVLGLSTRQVLRLKKGVTEKVFIIKIKILIPIIGKFIFITEF